MSKTLNLADQLLAMGRNFQSIGREHDALRILGRLSGLRQLPAEVSEEAQQRLAEMLLRAGRWVRARRHLTALLTQRPDSARYHYLMAGALDGDERSNPRRAAEHYRQSLRLDPKQPKCLGEFGLLALRLGEIEEGLSALRRAVELAPNDPEVVGRLVEGLRQEGMFEEARGAARAGLFRNPRDRRFQKLWNDFQFQQLREEQEAQRHGDDPRHVRQSGPRLLPFVRPEGTPTSTGRPLVRRDASSQPQPPHAPQPGWVPGKKHA